MKNIGLLFFFLFITCCFSTVYSATPKQWTFLIYLDGKNNLDRDGINNIKAMEKIGSTDNINVIVQWASKSRHEVKRLFIQKSSDPYQITSPVIENLGNVNMGDYKTLQDFVAWGIKNYPADHYFIDIWNHGSGWHSSRLKQSLAKSNSRLTSFDIGWDDDFPGSFISTEEVGQVMAFAAKLIGHKVDIYGSDACLMAMAEVAGEMTRSVDVFVGSQELEPGNGWPYDTFLAAWTKQTDATSEQIAKMLGNAYVDFYEKNTYQEDVTFSAYKLEKFDRLTNAIKKLGEEIQTLNPKSRAKVISASEKAQRFEPDTEDYVDLTDLLNSLIKTNLKLESIDKVQKALDQFVIFNRDSKIYSMVGGVSIWLPTQYWLFSKFANRYHGLEFDKATQWSNALDYLVER